MVGYFLVRWAFLFSISLHESNTRAQLYRAVIQFQICGVWVKVVATPRSHNRSFGCKKVEITWLWQSPCTTYVVRKKGEFKKKPCLLLLRQSVRVVFVQAVNSNTRRCLQFAVFFEQHAADFMKPSNCIVVSFEIKTITSDFYMPFFSRELSLLSSRRISKRNPQSGVQKVWKCHNWNTSKRKFCVLEASIFIPGNSKISRK